MFPDASVDYLNVVNWLPRNLAFWRSYDCIVFHSTFLSARYGNAGVYDYWKRNLLTLLKSVNAYKIGSPQDERYLCDELVEFFNAIRLNLLITIYGTNHSNRNLIYAQLNPDTQFYKTYPGLISEKLLSFASAHNVPAACRKVDILYRAKQMPVWVGQAGADKVRIYNALQECVTDLVIDAELGENNTLYGNRWWRALANSNYLLSSESGGGLVDKDGSITRWVVQQQSEGEQVDLCCVYNHFGSGVDGHPLTGIAPKNFEAMATRTCQILLEGQYSGLLQKGIHYIEVKRDLSNLESILNSLDDSTRDKIVEKCYDDFIRCDQFTYRSFINEIASIVESKASPCSQTSILGTLYIIANRFFERIPVIRLFNLIKLKLEST